MTVSRASSGELAGSPVSSSGKGRGRQGGQNHTHIAPGSLGLLRATCGTAAHTTRILTRHSTWRKPSQQQSCVVFPRIFTAYPYALRPDFFLVSCLNGHSIGNGASPRPRPCGEMANLGCVFCSCTSPASRFSRFAARFRRRRLTATEEAHCTCLSVWLERLHTLRASPGANAARNAEVPPPA
ncbi:hypothetical protein BKA81DRAFT_207537 [Phyllosticta paracitricarpa]